MRRLNAGNQPISLPTFMEIKQQLSSYMAVRNQGGIKGKLVIQHINETKKIIQTYANILTW